MIDIIILIYFYVSWLEVLTQNKSDTRNWWEYPLVLVAEDGGFKKTWSSYCLPLSSDIITSDVRRDVTTFLGNFE